MDTGRRMEENDGFPETLENLAKSMVSGPRDLRVAHRFRGTFNWEPWILDGALWKSLENKQILQSASNETASGPGPMPASLAKMMVSR